MGFCTGWLTVTIMCACSLNAPSWDCRADLHISPTDLEIIRNHGLLHGLVHSPHRVSLLHLCTPSAGIAAQISASCSRRAPVDPKVLDMELAGDPACLFNTCNTPMCILQCASMGVKLTLCKRLHESTIEAVRIINRCAPSKHRCAPGENCRFIAGHKGLGDWLFCTLISGAGLPLSFLLWHRSLYKSAINDGACS